MKQRSKKRELRRRLMTGIFCISLFAADLASAVPVWAKEPVEAEEQVQEAGEEGTGETQNPTDGNQEGTAQNPEGENGGEDGGSQTQKPEEENGGDDTQDPDEGKDGDSAQNPDEGKDGDNAQTPEEGNGGEGAQNPGDGEDGVTDDADAAEEEPETPDGEGTPGTDDQESVSENDPEEQEPSVSENDMEVLGEVRALAVPADAIGSGTYGNIKWLIDANGKLTVEGTGDYGESKRQNGIKPKAPWLKYADSILSAEVSVSGMTDAYGMFMGCSKMESVDLSKSDTSNVQYMDNMFAGCMKLVDFKDIKLGDFKTHNVVTMSRMFDLNSPITKLDLSSFDTSNVRDMSFMFASCYKLTDLDISGFDTGQVTTMRGMFSGCSSLASLDLSHFDTSQVKDMSSMFICPKLTSLDVSNFDTSQVTNMEGMFNCSSLTSLDVSNFNTSQVTNMLSMFNCPKLTSLDVSNFDTSQVTNMGGMFNCSSLTSLDVSNFDTSSVTNIGGMFGNCSSLTSLDVSNFDTSSVTDMAYMFSECSGLTELDLSNFNTENVENMMCMFNRCRNLTNLNTGSFNTGKVKNMQNMFFGCISLRMLDLSNFDCSGVTNAYGLLDLREFIGGKWQAIYAAEVIYTPCSLPIESRLPGNLNGNEIKDKWYDVNGNEYIELPQNLDYSIMLCKNKVPEKTAAHITAKKVKTNYRCGDTIGTDDLTVTCYGADGSVRKLTPEQYTTNAAQIDMTEAGEKKLVVTYVNGGTSLTAEITLSVTYGLTADNTTVTLPEEADGYIYDGTPKQPVPTAVSYTQNAAGGAGTHVTLSEGTDYTVSYRNNINAYEPSESDGSGAASGTSTGAAVPTVVIKGVGKYSGSVTKTFAIQKAASPAAETMDVIGSQCAQANPNRTADLTGSFRACGKKTGYEIVSVEDTKGIFSKTPVTADIRDGVLTYGTRAVQEGDTASIKVKVSFANYKDAELTVKITMAAKKAAVISGITMKESAVYSGVPVTCGGEAAVKTEDGKDITGQVSLVYQYSGVMADGTAYPAKGGTTEPPVNAGSYLLTISVNDDNPDYAGSVSYPFTIRKADAVVTAKDMVVLMQLEGEGSALVPVEQYQKDFGYTVTGLLNRDALTKEPSYKVTEDEAGTKTVTTIDTSKTGTYYIHPSDADAGMNYELAYKPGVLTVSEERVAYTVTFDGMGHCDTFTKSGIKSGALLELTDEERTPVAKEQGYVFAGWFKDKTFDRKKEWNFEADTVQSDLTLYACWMTAAGEDGDGLRLCVQEIPDLTYTGSAQKPSVTVYDSDGTTLLKAGKDYTVKYVRNTDAVAVDENGRPEEAGGTAKVTNPGKADENIMDVIGHFSKNCPYVVITGKGNYAETVYRNFLILPAEIAADSAGQAYNTPLAAGFTLKYTDQLVVNAKKEQKPFGSMKYKKGMKAGTDFTVTLGVADAEGAFDKEKNPLAADWKAEGTLNAKKQYTLPAIPKGYSGAFTLTVTGKGNYAGTVIRKLYVSDKQKLMKNAAITLGKNQKTFAYTGEDVLLTPGYYDAETKKYHKVTASGTVSSTAEANANDMFLVKAGKNGKTGGESLILGKDYIIDYAGTNRAVGTATMTLTGKNGYVGTKSITFQITGTPFSAKTIDVRAYDAAHPNEKDWKASMPYTGRAVTQNQVTLATKVTQKNPTSKELIYGEHYTIAYKNNVKKGTATMTFTAKPESGYSGSFKKTFKIIAQNLSKERLTVETSALSGVAYCKNGARLPFTITNEAGNVLREGTDYTVKYKNNNAVTTAQTPENKKPLMTVTGKGNYAGKVEVPFTVVQASLASALDDGTVQVSCVQVQKKNDMKFKDFKLKVMDGKAVLKAGVDYTVDDTGCTPEIISAYADALGAAGTAPEPKLVLTGIGNYGAKEAEGETAGDQREISLADYIYVTKLTAANLYVVVSEGAGQSIYTGGQVTPDVAVYYGEKTAVSAAKRDKVKEETVLTAQNGKYKLTKLAQKPSENAGDGGNAKDADYTVSYGANVQAGKNKGSVTVTGAGRYGGSVTVKFEIGKKAIY